MIWDMNFSVNIACHDVLWFGLICFKCLRGWHLIDRQDFSRVEVVTRLLRYNFKASNSGVKKNSFVLRLLAVRKF